MKYNDKQYKQYKDKQYKMYIDLSIILIFMVE